MNIIILVLVLFIFLLILLLLCPKEWFTSSPKTSSYNDCICVFDIDHTITCGNPKPFVDKCIEKGCRLAINTARPVKYVGDVDLDSINFKEPYFNKDDFYYNINSYSQTPFNVAKVKANYLQLLKDKYSVADKKCVVLLDDNLTNNKISTDEGFSTIKADNSKNKCGLELNKLFELDRILGGCSKNVKE